MYTKEELKEDIKNLGIQTTDTILMHTSLKKIGATQNGADTVIDAFCDCLSDGLFVVPGHTWSYISAENPVFDVKESKVCIGVLPEVFRKRKNVYRSLHPTHSLLAFGHDAQQFVSGEEKMNTPCAPNSCYGKLEKMDGKVVLAGVDFSRCTLVHCIEEVAKVPNRLTNTQEQLWVIDENGNQISVPSYRHHNANSDHYVKLEPLLEYRNVLTRGKLGDANVIVCRIQDLFRITVELLQKNPHLFDDDEPIPQEWF